MMPQRTLRRLIVWVPCVVIWVYSFAHMWSTGIRVAMQSYYGDFLGNFPSSTITAWFDREFMFQGTFAMNWLPPPLWGYGPVMNLVTLPLLWFDSPARAYHVWLFACYGFLAVAAWLLYRITEVKRHTLIFITCLAFIMLNYYPLYEALIQRNIEIFELTLVLMAMACYGKRHDVAAGILIGVATMTKFLPGILIPYVAFKRRWRVFVSAVLTVEIIALCAQSMLGWGYNAVVNSMVEGGGSSGSQLDQSISGYIMRVAWWYEGRVMLSQVIIVALGIGLAGMLHHVRKSDAWKLEWSLLLVAMVMLLPHNQNYYLIFLLVPYAVMLGMLFEGQLSGWTWWCVLSTSFLLTGWPFPLSLFDRLFGLPGGSGAELLLQLSVSTFGVALLTLVIVKGLSDSVERTRGLSARAAP